ncbi:hypothetical protein [Sporomusa sp.]|nr:hypothetical protein [Sporomusa sp.]HWR09202.1 hypothetical protein [Sporomusa sp.]
MIPPFPDHLTIGTGIAGFLLYIVLDIVDEYLIKWKQARSEYL